MVLEGLVGMEALREGKYFAIMASVEGWRRRRGVVGMGWVMPRHAGAAERAAGPTGEMGCVMPKVAGPAEKKAGQAGGRIGLGVRGFGVCFLGALRGLALGGVALGWALGVGGVAGACLGAGDGVKVRCRACRWACARGGSGVALEGRGGGVGGRWSPGRLEEEEGGGVVGERGTVAAH